MAAISETALLLSFIAVASGGIHTQVILDMNFDDSTSLAVTDPAGLGSPLPTGASWAFDKGSDHFESNFFPDYAPSSASTLVGPMYRKSGNSPTQ